jgi:hypothetical protein
MRAGKVLRSRVASPVAKRYQPTSSVDGPAPSRPQSTTALALGKDGEIIAPSNRRDPGVKAAALQLRQHVGGSGEQLGDGLRQGGSRSDWASASEPPGAGGRTARRFRTN